MVSMYLQSLPLQAEGVYKAQGIAPAMMPHMGANLLTQCC